MKVYKIKTISGQTIEYESESVNHYVCSDYPDEWMCIDNPGGVVIHININAIETIEEVPIVPPKKPWEDALVEDLELSVRSYNQLRRARLDTVQDILEYMQAHGTLLRIRNLGKKSQDEIIEKIRNLYGLDIVTGKVEGNAGDT